MSLFDLRDVCIAIGSIATLDLPMVVDLIGIYGLKGPYCTLTTTNWFLQALSVIPRGSWAYVSRRSYHDPLARSGIVIPEPQFDRSDLIGDRIYDEVTTKPPPPLLKPRRRRRASPEFVPVNLDEENPSAPISSGLLVQVDEGVSHPVVDLIDDIYRRLPQPQPPKVVSNEAPKKEESKASTLTSNRSVYSRELTENHRDEQYLGFATEIDNRENIQSMGSVTNSKTKSSIKYNSQQLTETGTDSTDKISFHRCYLNQQLNLSNNAKAKQRRTNLSKRRRRGTRHLATNS
ncbi:hypothetical protein F511_35628 [Dorcoceras hygrometricum]|uniref:Uncharacterized protein n=1 Tax=Dorcoceras hygrometricum TaxID=472368 RepID=A0A2Z7CZW8_9LAMI|nr:hypothetical protein F511_35628 [Dorcoceras hygrometricum]